MRGSLVDTETGAVYDDYKFVTREELASLGLRHLVGTRCGISRFFQAISFWKRSLAAIRQECCVSRSVLRAYMHGYFMDMRLYKKAQAVAQPFAYETYRQEQIDKKIDDEVRRAWRVFCFRLSLTIPCVAGSAKAASHRSRSCRR